MDVITVYQAGIPNVVATLGTALTEAQAKLLLKYCNEILICYDSDEAGQKATIRAIEIINAAGGRSRVIKLKGAKDPDEYIKANGSAMFLQAIAQAKASTEFRMDILKKKYSLDSPEGKAMYVAEATETLLSITDAVEVDAYINRISIGTQVNKDAVYSEYRKKMVKKSGENRQYANKETVNPKAEGTQMGAALPDKSKKLIAAEKKLICLMAQNKKYIDTVKENFTIEDFSAGIHQKLVRIIFEARENNILIEPSIVLNEFADNEINYVSDIFYNMEEYADDNAALCELINSIKLEKLSEKIETEKDPIILSRLVMEMQELRRKK